MATMTLWQRLSDIAGSISVTGSDLATRLCGGGTGGGVPVPNADLSQPHISVKFTMAVIALGAKMAKADGVVVGVEVEAFHRVFKTVPAEAANVTRLFDLAKADIAGFETYADQAAKALAYDPAMLSSLLDSLFHIATADRALHPGEDRFLETVAGHFGLSQSAYRHVRAHFVHDPENPYDVLGLDPSVDNETLKKRHRKLVRENHPDLVIGRGMPPELVAVATRKITAINDAYSQIARERRLA